MSRETQDIKHVKNIAKTLTNSGEVYRNSVLSFPDKYSSVWEGIAGTSNGEIFYVSFPSIENSVYSYNIQKPDNTYISMCTDCNRLYLVDHGLTDIVAYTIESLTNTPYPVPDWKWDTYGSPVCVCCDGNRVFIGNGNSGTNESMVESYLADGTGTSLLLYDEEGANGVIDMASNGQYLVVLDVSATQAIIISASDLTYVDHTVIDGLDVSSSVCISYDRYFVTVNDGMTLDRQLKSYSFDGSLLETIGWIPVLVNPQSRMCFDGKALFVHVDGMLYRCEHRYTTPVGYTWSSLVSSSCGSICVDDRYVYLWDNMNDVTLAVDKYTGRLKWSTSQYKSGPLCSDGVNVYSIQVSFPSGENYINKIPSRTMSKLFKKVSSQDTGRKYYTLANPV